MSLPGAPLNLTLSEEASLADWLDQELSESLSAHYALEEQLDKWQKAYDGEPASPRKDFPWPNACNIVIPLIGIAVDSIVARIVNTLFSVTPFWSIRPLNKEVELIAKPTEGFLEWSRSNEFNIYKEVRLWTPEVVKFGWGYIKCPWEVKTVQEFILGDNGQPVPIINTLRRPNPHWVPIRDIVTQVGIEDELEQAEWLAHRVQLTDGQLKWREADGIYQGVDDVIKSKEDMSTTTTLRNGVDFQYREKLNTLYEVWADVSISGSLPQSVVITFHKPTKKILRAIYNPIMSNKRPFVKAKFIEREGQMQGYGIAKRLFDLQEEISTIHRQQVDNSTIANTRFFLGKRGAIRPNTRIWPGRFLMVGDTEKDVKAVQLGDVYQSMHTLSVEILAFSERASGVSDPFLGRESSVVGTRATATGTLAILQEGNRRFDLNVRDIRDALSGVGRFVLELNHQFRPKGFAYFVQGQDGTLTEQMLELPREFIASRLAIELTASTATINREIERQGYISLLGLLTQYYDRTLQMGSLLANPNVPPELKAMGAKMAEGGRYIMQKLLQTFDIKNIDAVIPAMMEELNGSQGPQGDLGGGQPNGQLEGTMAPPGAA